MAELSEKELAEIERTWRVRSAPIHADDQHVTDLEEAREDIARLAAEIRRSRLPQPAIDDDDGRAERWLAEACPRCGCRGTVVRLHVTRVRCNLNPDGSVGRVLSATRKDTTRAEFECGFGHVWAEGQGHHG